MSDFGSHPPPDPPSNGSPLPPPPPPDLSPPSGWAQHQPSIPAPPPGYVAFGSPEAMAASIKPVRGIAKALVVLQWIMVGSSAIVLILQIALVGRANDFTDGVISESEFEDDLAPLLAVGLLVLLIAIAAVVLLIIWSFRISHNLRVVGRTITWSPGLTVVSWLLGGCTLNIITFLMLREHWKASDPEVSPGDQRWKTGPVTPLITGWFVLTLVGVVLAFAGGQRRFGSISVNSDTDSYADELSEQLPALIISGVASIAASVVLILIIRQMTTRHVAATREA